MQALLLTWLGSSYCVHTALTVSETCLRVCKSCWQVTALSLSLPDFLLVLLKAGGASSPLLFPSSSPHLLLHAFSIDFAQESISPVCLHSLASQSAVTKHTRVTLQTPN